MGWTARHVFEVFNAIIYGTLTLLSIYVFKTRAKSYFSWSYMVLSTVSQFIASVGILVKFDEVSKRVPVSEDTEDGLYLSMVLMCQSLAAYSVAVLILMPMGFIATGCYFNNQSSKIPRVTYWCCYPLQIIAFSITISSYLNVMVQSRYSLFCWMILSACFLFIVVIQSASALIAIRHVHPYYRPMCYCVVAVTPFSLVRGVYYIMFAYTTNEEQHYFNKYDILYGNFWVYLFMAFIPQAVLTLAYFIVGFRIEGRYDSVEDMLHGPLNPDDFLGRRTDCDVELGHCQEQASQATKERGLHVAGDDVHTATSPDRRDSMDYHFHVGVTDNDDHHYEHYHRTDEGDDEELSHEQFYAYGYRPGFRPAETGDVASDGERGRDMREQ